MKITPISEFIFEILEIIYTVFIENVEAEIKINLT